MDEENQSGETAGKNKGYRQALAAVEMGLPELMRILPPQMCDSPEDFRAGYMAAIRAMRTEMSRVTKGMGVRKALPMPKAKVRFKT